MAVGASAVPEQICIVVPSVDEAVRIWHSKYGVGPWALVNVTVEDGKVDGRDEAFAFRAGITTWGPLEFEVIEPLDDRSHYAQTLADHGGRPHLHHVKISHEDYEEACSAMLASGHRIVQSGRVGEFSFAYFSLGHQPGWVTELSTRRPHQQAAAAFGTSERYPPD